MRGRFILALNHQFTRVLIQNIGPNHRQHATGIGLTLVTQIAYLNASLKCADALL